MNPSPMVKRGLVSLFTIGALAIGVAGGAQPASMALRLDNAQLISRSDVVVYGRVTAVKTAGPTSESTIAVECSLKGAPGKQVTVAFSAGQAESPVFAPEEVVLLFLTETAPGRYQTTGGEQGKFSFGRGKRARPSGR